MSEVKEFKGKTKSGFEFVVPRSNIDNMELIDAICDLNDGNGLATSKVVTLLLGKEQKKELYDHVRTENGNVPTQAVADEVREIMDACGKDAKN